MHVGQNSDFLSKFFQILPDEVILLTSVILETDFPKFKAAVERVTEGPFLIAPS